MTREYQVMIDGRFHSVMVSDETEALLAAKAAGKASVGLWKKGSGQDWSPAEYLVESTEDLDGEYLEQVVRRHLKLPWVIGETDRLAIREFKPGDETEIPKETTAWGADEVFCSRELLESYIRCQYGFYGYGIWAVTKKGDGTIVGKAGLTNLTGQWECAGKPDALELGYHIFVPYRGQGLAAEACREVLKWYGEHMECPLYAKIDASNEASKKVAQKLGFTLKDRKCTGSGQWLYLYGWNC